MSVPLVFHGSSGVPGEDVQHAIKLGICKVNFAIVSLCAGRRIGLVVKYYQRLPSAP